MIMNRTEIPVAKATSPWVIGIIVGFVVLVLVNFAFIYIAVEGADPIVSSYNSEAR